MTITLEDTNGAQRTQVLNLSIIDTGRVLPTGGDTTAMDDFLSFTGDLVDFVATFAHPTSGITVSLDQSMNVNNVDYTGDAGGAFDILSATSLNDFIASPQPGLGQFVPFEIFLLGRRKRLCRSDGPDLWPGNFGRCRR